MISRVIRAQMEMGERQQKLKTLQSKVSEVKKFSQSQETPAKLQVLRYLFFFFFKWLNVTSWFNLHSTDSSE